MAEASISVDQDQFSCPVCLCLLNDPVTIPCGHSFCKVCINGHWDQEDVKGVYSCPQCRETFTPRPVLRRNNMLAEVVDKVKTELQAASPAHCYAGPGDVECDSCTGRKRKASQEKICSEHDKPMEIYCRTDKSFICYCMMEEHKGHDTVSAKTERTKKQNELKKEQMKCQQRIQEKEKKVQELNQTVESVRMRSQAAVDDSEMIFTELISYMEKKRSELTELIRAQENAEVSRAKRLVNQLEQEIADLKRRVTEMKQLSHTRYDIHFLQSFPSLCVSPGCDDSPSFTVNQHLSFDGVRKSLSDLKKRVKHNCEEELNKIRPQAPVFQMALPSKPKSREDFLQYFCHLTLDPKTAHCQLILSEKNRVVTRKRGERSYPEHPERFDSWPQVLCKESLCGRCYWEVEWSGKGVDISVSFNNIRRKGRLNSGLFGRNSQSWSLQCFSFSHCFWHNGNKTELRGPSSSRIGVYVDHSAGTLSFYSVSDTMRLLHSVHIPSNKPLYAGFRVCYLYSTLKLCDKV